jgi:hypothetical protein
VKLNKGDSRATRARSLAESVRGRDVTCPDETRRDETSGQCGFLLLMVVDDIVDGSLIVTVTRGP